MSFVELGIVAVLALLLLGPDQLPGVARTIGKGLRDLRRASDDLKGTFEQEMAKLDAEVSRVPPKPKPAAPPAGASKALIETSAVAGAAGASVPLDQARQAGWVPSPGSDAARASEPARIDPGALRAQARMAAAPQDPAAARAAARKAASVPPPSSPASPEPGSPALASAAALHERESDRALIAEAKAEGIAAGITADAIAAEVSAAEVSAAARAGSSTGDNNSVIASPGDIDNRVAIAAALPPLPAPEPLPDESEFTPLRKTGAAAPNLAPAEGTVPRGKPDPS